MHEAYAFVHLTEDGNGGLKAAVRIYSEPHPTVAHLDGVHLPLCEHHGHNAMVECVAQVAAVFPSLKVDHV